MLSPRGEYITLLKSRRNRSIQLTRQAYLHKKNSIKIKSYKKKERSCESNQQFHTDRNKMEKKSNSINRRSINRIDKQVDLKSIRNKSKKEAHNMWNQAHLPIQKQNYEDSQRKNKEGINCRIVIMNNGKTQQEHFLQIKKIGDIRNFLQKTYSKIKYFKTVPRQLSLEYLLTQRQASGQFLNGQSIYFKPQFEDVGDNLLKNEKITLQNFQIIKPIGSGGFSKVFLCRCKFDNNFYAMKLIDKEMIVKNKKKRIIMNERNIMKQSSHPFVIDLKYAFETEKYLIFIVEYCAGGELFGLIRRYRRLSQDMARFYIIQIFLGLGYLHGNKVVYRDIKPQNILLGLDGHVKIADLGLAKPDMHEGELAYSFCGSPEYMSPQMIMQTGHTYPVDYYCMGALLFELLTGLPPFYSQDPDEIYEAVLVQELTFPQDLVLTNECKSLLKSLLCKDSKQRLGSLHGIKQILAHPWFGKNTYKTFIQKKVQPPVNFKGLQKIGLDHENEDKKQANKEVMDKVLKDQRNERRQFKTVMKNFSFDFRVGKPFQEIADLNKSKLVSPLSLKRNFSSERSKKQFKENNELLRKMKAKPSGTQIYNNSLRGMFHR